MAGGKGRSNSKREGAKKYKATLRKEQNKANRIVRAASKSSTPSETLKKELDANGNKDIRRFAEKYAIEKGI